MSTIGCNEFLNHLGEWMEGKRASGSGAHLRDCARCRAVVDDLDAIRHAARASAISEAEPPAWIWASLRARLEQEGLIHSGHGGWTERWREYLGEAFTVTPRPVLASAYLAAVIAIAVALAVPAVRQSSRDRWLAGTQSFTQPLSAQLASVEQDTIASFANSNSNPVVTASLHQNLAIVDNYIALCEKSVLEEPDNEFARDYLYDAYQQKAALLAQMTERGEFGR